MDYKELLAMLAQRGTIDVEFLEPIEEVEGMADDGMRATLYAGAHDGDECVLLHFDYSKFEPHNRTKAKPNYFDQNGIACLTVFETNHYEAKDSNYFAETDDFRRFFRILDDKSSALFDRYLQAMAQEGVERITYVQWLENLVLAAGA